MATSTLPSRGAKNGRIGYITRAFSGSPIEGDKFRRVCITPKFLEADSLVGGGRGAGTGGEWSEKDAKHDNTAPIQPFSTIQPIYKAHRDRIPIKNSGNTIQETRNREPAVVDILGFFKRGDGIGRDSVHSQY